MPIVLDDSYSFPDPKAVDDSDHDGLVALGGDMHPDRLISAYSSGIFPWSVDPITWWSPDPRAIFEWDGFHVSRSLKRRLRQADYSVTFDQAFDLVIAACTQRKDEGTWITDEFIEAYTTLHRLGCAHSVETWFQGELVGGLYGVSIGGLFAGESMFHRQTDASKVALHTLHSALREAGFGLFDIQMLTQVTEQLGAIEIERESYLQRVKAAVKLPCQFPSSSTS
ncbi:MAG: leucyl/phenylalanyl-tRNA--protein transferase [Verrucomicrobia bacterium]|nr:leucyl/phenylalanyl-tRNA--protein transferase [Verrucomicrobiota bacterium]